MQTRLIPLLLLVGLSLAGPARGESPAANTDEQPQDMETDTAPAEASSTSSAGEETLDPYVITPEQKARLDAQREGMTAPETETQQDTPETPKPGGQESEQAETAEEDGSADTAARENEAGPELHPLVRSFIDSRYGREHCSAPNRCDNLVELQCLKSGDGPIYYYNNDNGRLLMTCGRACLNPDPYDERDCKKCPYTPWVDCQERAWREEQKRLLQARQKEIEQLQAEEAERQAREAEILKRISEIEQDCNTRIRELQHELDTLEEPPGDKP